MPWAKNQPTNPKYRTRQHTHTRAQLMAQLKRDGQGLCAEPVCVMPSRLITPDMQLHLSHDVTGTYYLGLSHMRCNITAAAREARRRQTRRHSRQW
jgi:hypothetical protein